MDLSVIIVNWNTREVLRACLESVLCQESNAALEIWVVDNASHDGSAAMVRHQFPTVRLIENQENVGFARANNQAIAASSGRYVLLLNSDTVVHPGALDALLHFMETHPEAGAAGPHILNPDGSRQISCYPSPTLARELWFLLHLDHLRPYGAYDMRRWSSDQPRAVDAVLGACLITRRPILEQLGALDPAYFMYSEEIDLCFRIRRAGWRIYWVPQASIVHYGGQSTQQVAASMFMQLYRSKVHFFRKNRGRMAATGYKLVLLLAALPRLLLTPLSWLEPPTIARRHRTLAGHYWSLLRALPAL